MPRDKVPIAKVRRNEADCSSTIEGSKEQPCEPNGEEKKKTLQDLVQNLERMLNERNEYITTLREEHNGQTLKRRWTPEGGDSWDGQIMGVKNGSTSALISVKRICKISSGLGLGSFVQVICFISKNKSPVTFWINGSWPCWKSLVLTLLHLHHAYLHLKNACTHPHVSC